MHFKRLYSKQTEDSVQTKQYKSILEYYIVERRIGEQYCELKSYGIQIRKVTVFEGGRESEESKFIGDIFFDEQDTENFVKILADNKVKPSEFKGILDKFVAETIAMRKNNKSA